MRPAYRWRIIFGALLVCAVSGAVFLFSPKPVVADPENAHISFMCGMQRQENRCGLRLTSRLSGRFYSRCKPAKLF